MSTGLLRHSLLTRTAGSIEESVNDIPFPFPNNATHESLQEGNTSLELHELELINCFLNWTNQIEQSQSAKAHMTQAKPNSHGYIVVILSVENTMLASCKTLAKLTWQYHMKPWALPTFNAFSISSLRFSCTHLHVTSHDFMLANLHFVCSV